MRRTAPLLLVTILGFALTACAPAVAPVEPGTDAPAEATPVESPSQAAQDAANALCADKPEGNAQVCLLEEVNASGDLVFSGYQVVKIIGGAYSGSVSIAADEQIVITEALFDADLDVNAPGTVVKLSTIGGSLSLADGRHATLVENRIGGDLNCAAAAEMHGNQVGGATAAACTAHG